MTTQLPIKTSTINRLRSIFILAILVTLSACDKDEEITRTELLTSEAWNFSEVTTDVPGIDVSEANMLFQGFTITFDADGSYTGNFPNNDGDPNIGGSWGWGAGETTIILDAGTTESDEIPVPELTETTLVLEILELDDITNQEIAFDLHLIH